MTHGGRALLLVSAGGRDSLGGILGEPHELVLARGIDEALQAIRSRLPELVLGALEPDGLALLRELRSQPHTRELPVLLLASSGDPELRAAALLAGADDCLGLPLQACELDARIERHIQAARVRREAIDRAWRSEQRLKRQNETLVDLAKQRIADRGDLIASLRQLMRAAAHTLEVARSSVWLYGPDRASIECVELYELAEDRHSSGLSLHSSSFPAYFSALETERIIAAADAYTDPHTGCFAEPYLRPLGIGAMLDAPIRVHGRMIGVVCHEHIGAARPWELEEQNFAASLADLVALALEANERRQAEAALREGEDRFTRALEEADRRKDDFLAILGHELRSPLSAISTAVQILALDGLDPDKLAWARGVLERQVQTLARLADDLSDISRIARGGIELRRQKLDLRSVLLRAVEATAAPISARKHRLAVQAPSEPIPVEADPIRLEQVLVNLLNNAAKYMDPGGDILLGLTREGPEAVVRVRDSGIGIAPDLLPNIWDLYTRGQQPRARAQDGLGIGLTLVRRLVELHGGRVEARSPGIGLGSEFLVSLPAL